MTDTGMYDEHGTRRIPLVEVSATTIVHDKRNNRQVMRLNGVIILPIGSEVELINPNVSATVIGVRLLASVDHYPATVCLDVEVPPEYWR